MYVNAQNVVVKNPTTGSKGFIFDLGALLHKILSIYDLII